MTRKTTQKVVFSHCSSMSCPSVRHPRRKDGSSQFLGSPIGDVFERVLCGLRLLEDTVGQCSFMNSFSPSSQTGYDNGLAKLVISIRTVPICCRHLL